MNWNNEGYYIGNVWGIYDNRIIEQVNYGTVIRFFCWTQFSPCSDTVAIWRKKETK